MVTLHWGGRLHQIAVPAGLSGAGAMAYAQAVVVGAKAPMQIALTATHPGLRYADQQAAVVPPVATNQQAAVVAPITSPLPFGSAVYGLDHAVSFAECGTSSPAASHRTPTQTQTPPPPSPAVTDAASGTAGPRKRPTPVATSTASRPLFRGVAAATPPSASQPPKPHATPRKGGWMGSGPTNGPNKGGAGHA